MANHWDFNTASEIVGHLYGDLLGRSADPTGFTYGVDQLTGGHAELPDLVTEFCTSEEFREKWVMNQTPNELARRLLMRFYNIPFPNGQEVKELAVQIAEGDWRDAVRSCIQSERYRATYGQNRIPLWV